MPTKEEPSPPGEGSDRSGGCAWAQDRSRLRLLPGGRRQAEVPRGCDGQPCAATMRCRSEGQGAARTHGHRPHRRYERDPGIAVSDSWHGLSDGVTKSLDPRLPPAGSQRALLDGSWGLYPQSPPRLSAGVGRPWAAAGRCGLPVSECLAPTMALDPTPRPSQYAACAAFTHPIRRYSPDRCWRAVVSEMPSSWAAAAAEPALMYARRTSSCRRVGRCLDISRPSDSHLTTPSAAR
jgi:hypothetical protein